ncbi:MAG: hypothetical protein COV07_00385 [Candidatus Vogelbacteria bacterium CG10_big_fil_rev_8_21_14_0_10_45_14]|uniref:Uncharacterized protein n=1 Tax=Candidatus Vogelbacteria bacterium CG10_big_fil_rev_8_21_14_0_10_45_14 TaxID=1975042 RepID=A0A2H0RKX9_9BACT|nr:MAG: hypothetical protein COV07_00385 [Candidatus Vogelbacteria bacterium CG10_big_fil_rev_8_21_14_0_10_45_14]
MKIILGYNANEECQTHQIQLLVVTLSRLIGVEVHGRGSAGYNGHKIAHVLEEAKDEPVVLIATDSFLRCSYEKHTMFGFSMDECVEGSESVYKRYCKLAEELSEKALKLALEHKAVVLDRLLPYLVHNVRWMREICKDLKIVRLTDMPMESENKLSECDRTITMHTSLTDLAKNIADIVHELQD